MADENSDPDKQLQASQYLARAEELRVIAEALTTERARESVLAAAEDYEGMAARLSQKH